MEFPNVSRLLLVMIFIHEGGFSVGDGNRDQFYNPDILLDKDIVLVTLQYRLGPLGFFTTGNEVVPGNNGLKDQTLALRWVKKNIINFGGNPDSITVWGQSAGGTGAHLHMLSPMSKGLFHKAISQSGTGLNRRVIVSNNKGLTVAKELALSVNCSIAFSVKIVKCLKRVDVSEIIER
ncbi:hypothetical protein ILUMI_17988 [Ignelater luminosus]|uniref:Carboxylic ester hydrolase n=1 Tax=Ignelater luminosus TaxID=2038154 RepID=A0A8K0CJ69_IGNLU|nr:hypothetical protein ILUMI_17988 [Ignelater luminosus]